MKGFRHSEVPSTDFAITTVNVPDRLDQREVDDRKQEEEHSSLYAVRGWGSVLRTWSRRLLPYLILLVVLALAGSWLSNQREKLAAEHISQRMSVALHVPVRVQDSRIRTTPTPGLVLKGIDLGSQVHLDEITLEFTAPSLWQAVMSGQRRWGDAVVSSTTLTLDQSGQLLTWLGSLDRLVPETVTRVRFAQVRFAGSRLLPDSYEAFTRREASGHFATVTLHRLSSPGSMQLQVTPDRAGGPIAFQCDAADWQPPFTPKTAWSEFAANGHFGPDALVIERFSLGSAFGGIEGRLTVTRREPGTPAWLADGHLSTVGIDIPTLIQQAAGLKVADAAAPGATPMSGTAAIDAALVGGGNTLDEALADLIADGEVTVRSATLNGINLGFAASRPASHSAGSGATTRFTRLQSSFVAGSSGVLFRKIHGVAGALSTRGELSVTPNLTLDGLLHVDLGGARIQAPLRIHVRGALAHPQFGR
jgi:hypothetical protein